MQFRLADSFSQAASSAALSTSKDGTAEVWANQLWMYSQPPRSHASAPPPQLSYRWDAPAATAAASGVTVTPSSSSDTLPISASFSIRDTLVSLTVCAPCFSQSATISCSVIFDTSTPSTSVRGRAVSPYTVCTTTQAARYASTNTPNRMPITSAAFLPPVMGIFDGAAVSSRAPPSASVTTEDTLFISSTDVPLLFQCVYGHFPIFAHNTTAILEMGYDFVTTPASRRLGMWMVSRISSSVSRRPTSAPTPADCISRTPRSTLLRNSRTSLMT